MRSRDLGLTLFLFGLNGTGCVARTRGISSPLPQPTVDLIMAREDQREADDLVPLLRDPDPIVRARVALALGRIAAPATLASLREALRDPNPEVREATAFALGIADDSGAEAALLSLPTSPMRDFALGRVGGEATLVKAPTPRVLMGFAQRKLPIGEPGVAALIAALSGDERLLAAHTFVRLQPEGNTHAVSDALMAAANDANAEVRAASIRALAAWTPQPEVVLEKALLDAAPGVRVQAVRALAQASREKLAAHLTRESDVEVLLAALDALDGQQWKPPAALTSHSEPAIRCRAQRFTGSVASDCPVRQRAAVAPDEAALRALAQDPRNLSAVAEKAADRDMKVLLRELLASRDAGAVAAAADGVRLAAERGDKDFEAVVPLTQALGEASSDEAVEAMIAILGALGVLEDPSGVVAVEKALSDPNVTVRIKAREALVQMGRKPAEPQPRRSVPSPGDVKEALSTSLTAVVETDRGPFTMELLGKDAPRTVASFVHLARRKFYDGLTFHRVVPDFVVQGGDPRGDGYGGAGYSLRCEYNSVPYERGTVGMALAGKDTGSSQWFVAQSAQPHLFARYTVFGRVVRGLEVIDRLLPGDHIRKITIRQGSAP